jgi:hypothetical protein
VFNVVSIPSGGHGKSLLRQACLCALYVYQQICSSLRTFWKHRKVVSDEGQRVATESHYHKSGKSEQDISNRVRAGDNVHERDNVANDQPLLLFASDPE